MQTATGAWFDFPGAYPYTLSAQTTSAAPGPQADDLPSIGEIERRIATLTDSLTETQAALKRSEDELVKLRAEVSALRAQSAVAGLVVVPNSSGGPSASTSPASDTSLRAEVDSLKEQQEVLQAEVKQHEQAKVESSSKYNVAVTGLVLFNAYSNAGVVDDTELPSLALPRNAGSSHGSLGATLRQSVLGIVASGPVIAGAQSFAAINADFFGGSTTNSFGYTALGGYLRMRDSEIGLSWNRSSIQIGYSGPFISPLSPTSFATVAQPALSASGNLWVWSPQLKLQQSVPLHGRQSLSLEAGLISPPSPAYTSTQLDSPVEASRRPGVEGRVAYRSDNSATASPRSLSLGVGAYTASQFYNSTTQVHSWAVTGDWQVPLTRWIDLSGEIYRGTALGGLGGGLYKDIFSGADPITGLSHTVGVDTAGGWTQLKLTFTPRWETNAMFGLDDAFSSSFRSIVPSLSSSSLTLTARNSTVTGNLIFRPRASLVFSPEYRRVLTWRYTGAPFIANIFTFSAGYKF